MTGQSRPAESEWGNVRRIFNDVATLAARIGVGGIFFANGWDKLEAGLNATTAQFAQQGAPLPNVWAALAMLIELLGGAMLIAGFAVPVCGILLFVEALAVFIGASGDQGQPLTGGDTNLIVALGAASILLAVVGAGRVSVDHMVVIKRRETDGAPEPDPDAEADAMLAALREPPRQQGALGAGSPESSAAGASGASTTASGSAATSRRRDAEEKSAPARPASPPAPAGGGGAASSGAAESAPKARKPRQRRTGTGSDTGSDSTTASPSEAPVAAEKGDKLVAGRREGAAD